MEVTMSKQPLQRPLLRTARNSALTVKLQIKIVMPGVMDSHLTTAIFMEPISILQQCFSLMAITSVDACFVRLLKLLTFPLISNGVSRYTFIVLF
jgi:hypothetical protein